MGLLQPTSGSLEIDGVRITEENHRAWQVHIAHVPQAIFLADTSMAEILLLVFRRTNRSFTGALGCT